LYALDDGKFDEQHCFYPLFDAAFFASGRVLVGGR
jgi:hypothetical protein